MNKREILARLLAGELTDAQAKVHLRGLTFWALQDEDNPAAFDVEVRQFAQLVERRTMTAAEVEALKPASLSWTVTQDGETEFVHPANRDEFAYQ